MMGISILGNIHCKRNTNDRRKLNAYYENMVWV